MHRSNQTALSTASSSHSLIAFFSLLRPFVDFYFEWTLLQASGWFFLLLCLHNQKHCSRWKFAFILFQKIECRRREKYTYSWCTLKCKLLRFCINFDFPKFWCMKKAAERKKRNEQRNGYKQRIQKTERVKGEENLHNSDTQQQSNVCSAFIFHSPWSTRLTWKFIPWIAWRNHFTCNFFFLTLPVLSFHSTCLWARHQHF